MFLEINKSTMVNIRHVKEFGTAPGSTDKTRIITTAATHIVNHDYFIVKGFFNQLGDNKEKNIIPHFIVNELDVYADMVKDKKKKK